MSNYTTSVLNLVKYFTPGQDENNLSTRITNSITNFFDFDFPIWSEEYRPILEKKIISHYINKEIGMETVELWKFYLEERLNLIMPYYNKLYLTTVKEYDYFDNVNLTEIYNENGSKNGSTNVTISNSGNFENKSTGNIQRNDNSTLQETASKKTDLKEQRVDNSKDGTKVESASDTQQNGNETDKRLTSDLPQANYANLDYGTVLNDDTKNITNSQSTTTNDATEYKHDNQTDIAKDGIESNNVNRSDNSAGSETSNNSEYGTNTSSGKTDSKILEDNDRDYTRVQKGSNGSKSFTQLLLEYRDSLLNIDKLIIEELSDLFIMIF